MNKRRLTIYQSREWMQDIGRNRKYKNQAKGEQSGRSKLTEWKVNMIRSYETMPVSRAKSLSRGAGVSVGYIYQLRKWKTWKHLKTGRRPVQAAR